MPQSLECIEYRAASAKGSARRKRGSLDARLVDVREGAEVEVRGGDSRRPHRIPVSRLIALTIHGERHMIGAAPEDVSARAAQVRRLLGQGGNPVTAPVPAVQSRQTPVAASPVARPHPPVPFTPLPAPQPFMGRGGTTSALVPERAYGCLLFAIMAICTLEVLVMIAIRST